jgi:hypothetical protein
MRFLVVVLLLGELVGHAQAGLQPPCGSEPVPPYPPLDSAASVASWSTADVGADWQPPACTGWKTPGFTTLVSVSARFRFAGDGAALLHRVGAISQLRGMRYWSTTHKQWQTLITEAHALTGSAHGERRPDFMPEDMTPGRELFFEQVDNLSGKALYRMHIDEVLPARIVIDVENMTTMRYMLVPVLHPGDAQSVYFFDRESPMVWRYYSIMRTGKSANRLISGNAASSMNRAQAFYRLFAGIPTDQEPPAAR